MAMSDSLRELLEAKRGRPRKNPLPATPAKKKDADDEDDDDYGPDTGPEADKNVIVQLKKAADNHGNKGGADIEFANGKKSFVKSDHAMTVIRGLEKLKPTHRKQAQALLHTSPEHFTAAHKFLSGLKESLEEGYDTYTPSRYPAALFTKKSMAPKAILPKSPTSLVDGPSRVRADKNYDFHHNESMHYLGQIENALKKHKQYAGKSELNWGHAGDVAHVHDKLREIHDFLSQVHAAIS